MQLLDVILSRLAFKSWCQATFDMSSHQHYWGPGQHIPISLIRTRSPWEVALPTKSATSLPVELIPPGPKWAPKILANTIGGASYFALLWWWWICMLPPDRRFYISNSHTPSWTKGSTRHDICLLPRQHTTAKEIRVPIKQVIWVEISSVMSTSDCFQVI